MKIEYEGPVYIRPLGRGIVIGDVADPSSPYFEDWFASEVKDYSYSSGWEGNLRITVEEINA